MVIHPSRETRYGTVALSQKGNTCIQVIFTQSSVSLTTTPEYLPVSGFNVPSLHLSQSSRLHPFQVSQTAATIRVAKVIPDLPVTLHNCPNSGQRKNMKTNSQQSFLFRFKFSSKQFPLPTQSRSFPLTYSTTYSTQTLPQLQLKPRMLPDASEKSRSTFPNRWCPHVSLSHSVVNQQSQHQVPLCLQCHDGSYLSLSTPVPILPGKPQCFRLQFQGYQSVQTSVKPHSSCTLPNLRCSTTHVLSHTCGNPILSWTKVTDKANSTLQVLMPQFLSLSAKITKLSSDSPGSRCQSHQTSHTTKMQISHATQLQHTITCSSVVVTYFPTLTTTVRNSIAYIYHISHTTLGSQVF